jgi:hypothetical protein
VKLTLRLRGEDRKPLAGATCWVHGLGAEAKSVTAGGEGDIEVEVPIHVARFDVVVEEPELVFNVEVGGMDPINESTGTAMRLRQLGFMVDEEPVVAMARDLGLEIDYDEVDDASVGRAMAAFQKRTQGAAADASDPSGALAAEYGS